MRNYRPEGHGMKITKRNGARVGCRPELQPSGESRIGYEQTLDTSSTTPTVSELTLAN